MANAMHPATQHLHRSGSSPSPASQPTGWRRWARHLITVFGFVAMGVVLWNARQLDWSAATEAIGRLPLGWVALAAVCAMAGHANYGGFDVLSRHWLGLRVRRLHSWLIGLVSYACTLNFGSILGGAAVRWRLYDAAGLSGASVAQVVSLAVVTNWLGFASLAVVPLLGGAAFVPSGVPQRGEGDLSGRVADVAQGLQSWFQGPAPRMVGFVLVGLFVAWVALVAWRGGQPWRRGASVRLPTAGEAAVQWVLGVLNWVAPAAVVWCLLRPLAEQSIPFVEVLAAQVLAALAVLAARIPGGVGVLEAVYLWVLHERIDTGALLGALLVFRALYYLMPLIWAVFAYVWLNSRLAPASGGPHDAPPAPH